jgi:phospho-2-dehydro-3-deoxyheptonate aldolase
MAVRSLLAANTVLEGRKAVEAILKGDDDRLVVVVGCVVLSFFSPIALIKCRNIPVHVP